MGTRNKLAEEKVSCPYWSISSKNCLYSKGGLYLPVTEHIRTYCQTPNYLLCPQFEGKAFTRSTGLLGEDAINRRDHERIPGRFAFKLSGCLKDDDLVPLLDDSASTVDISPGGIRFESYREIPVDALVSFSLIADSEDQPLEGIGRVKWCKSLDNAPVYHAGIAFTDKSVPSAVRNRLGLFVN